MTRNASTGWCTPPSAPSSDRHAIYEQLAQIRLPHPEEPDG
ncbi:MAG: hypothetical protein V9G12_16685 [Microthrixaceae bacterium]